MATTTTDPPPGSASAASADPRHRRSVIEWCLGAIWMYAFTVLVLAPEGTGHARRLAWLGVLAVVSALGLGIARYASGWLRGVSLLVVGFAMLPVLFGAVAERVAREPSVGAVLGLVAGIGVIVLLVEGWSLTLHGLRRRWARVAIAIAGSLAVLQFLTVPATWAVIATNRARPTGTGRTPADLGMAYRDVRIAGEAGIDLAAWWIPPHNGRAVIVLPGSGSTKDDTLDHAAVLTGAGYGALLLDPAGHGESGGRLMDFGWGSDADVKRAMTWTLDQPGVGHVGLLGLSMGGEIALTAAAHDRRVEAVVADGATARTWDDVRALPEPNPIATANDWVEFGLVRLLARTTPPMPLLDAVQRIDAPVLLITGNAPREHAYGERYAAAAPDTLTWWDLSDTGHVQALATHPDEYRQRVLALFGAAMA
jgi:pimeloyl-ACP methyl ester carboxylesterase